MPDSGVPFVIGVKRSLFRLHDPFREEADEAFRRIRQSALARDHFTCQFCGMQTSRSEKRPSGYFEVHHLNNDHRENRLENLATVCPFCHQVFHAGMAARGPEPGVAIFFPWLDQWKLNRLCHVLFVLMEIAPDPSHKTEAERVYHLLQDAATDLKGFFGEDAKKLSSFSKAIAELPENLYDKRAEALSSVRILPIRDVFEDAVRYWAERMNASIPVGSWSQILKNALRQSEGKA
ncbi:type IVB secretion system protein IcmJDotN [Leptospirillum ferriphilum]|uniref:type IVB secretion system protein IcmJDotN n=1 Tax=Leptospirillum ferriphilum TaxID=178606 RepID=UPI000B055D81|nr:type IVB secretion system protein IcmJDotN [Leptospirillum ferriphilum]